MSKVKTTRCTVCMSPDRDSIDRALLIGLSARECSAKFGLGRCSVQRHSLKHIAVKKGDKIVAKVNASVEIDRIASEKYKPVRFTSGESVLNELETLYNATMLLSAKAEAGGDVRTQLRCNSDAGALLQKLGVAWNVFGPDGAVTVNLSNTSEKRITAIIDGMTTEELERYVRESDVRDEVRLKAQQEHIEIYSGRRTHTDEIHALPADIEHGE